MSELSTEEIAVFNGKESVRHCIDLGNGLILSPSPEPSVEDRGGWTITHKSSGYSISPAFKFLAPDQIRKHIKDIAEIANWEREKEELVNDDNVAEEVKNIKERMVKDEW